VLPAHLPRSGRYSFHALEVLAEADIFLPISYRTPQVPDRCFYEFGPFRLDPSGRVLFRGAQAVPCHPRPAMSWYCCCREPVMCAKDELLKRSGSTALWKTAV